MSGIRMPIRATRLSLDEMAAYLATAFLDVFGVFPSESEFSWLMALARHENANGNAIINFNWGNRIASLNDNYWVPKWADLGVPNEALTQNELATRERYNAGQPVPGKFAAFSSHAEGVRKFLALFKTETHARILEAAKRDDAYGFWNSIHTPHPKTKRVYCVECGKASVREAYRRLRDDSAQYYPGPKGEPSLSGAEQVD